MTGDSVHHRFHQKFLGRGGVLIDPQSHGPDGGLNAWLIQRFRARLRQLSSQPRAYPKTCSRVYVDAIDNPALNAVAAESAGTGLIGFYSGCSTNLTRFFSSLLSHRKVLPTLGNPKAEARWSADFSRIDWTADFGANDEGTRDALGIDAREPLDPVRRRVASVLVTLAMDFMFFHELGHIAGGHARHFEKRYGLAEMAEDDRLRPDVVDDRHAAEIDADSIAVRLCGYGWHDVLRESHPLEYNEVVEIASLWAFSVGCLFFLFSKPALGTSARLLGTHPHPSVRLVRVRYESVSAACDLDLPIVPERIEEAWNWAIDAIQNARSVLRFASSIDDVFENDRSGVYDTASRLQHQVRSLRTRCAPHAESRPT